MGGELAGVVYLFAVARSAEQGFFRASLVGFYGRFFVIAQVRWIW
jgi:hypothetical protein